MSVWDRRSTARLAEIAVSLWLPPNAPRAAIEAAVEGLSDRDRRDDLRRQLASIPFTTTGRLDTSAARDGRRRP